MSHTAIRPHDNPDWNPDDPHASTPHYEHDSHFVADWRMQVTVLVVLLSLTVVTVGFYLMESWVETAFGIHLPRWVNISGVMTVAIIKGMLVAAFFMQLRYDKVLNTFVLLFCLVGVGLFLTFPMIDLDTRGIVNPEEAEHVEYGGTGYDLNAVSSDPEFSVRIGPRVNTQGKPIVYEARLNGNKNMPGVLYYRERGNEAHFWEHFYGDHATHRDAMDEHNYFEKLGYAKHHELSTANRSRPQHGLTPGLFSDVAPAGHAGDGHDDEHSDEQNEGNESGENDTHDDGH